MKQFLLVVLGMACLSMKAQTVDEVIQKHITAMGGMDAFNNIKSIKFTGTLTVQGRTLPLTLQILNGKGVRSDIELEGQKVTTVYYEGKAWKINPRSGSTAPVDVSGNELNDLKAQAFITPSLMEYKLRGQAELLGKDSVGPVLAFKIKFTNDGGRVTTYFISAQDYLPVKSVTDRVVQGETMESETWFSDLKEYNEAKFFMTRENKVMGLQYQLVKYDKIELNIPIDVKIFSKE